MYTRQSIFLKKEKLENEMETKGNIKAGPVWDYNFAFAARKKFLSIAQTTWLDVWWLCSCNDTTYFMEKAIIDRYKLCQCGKMSLSWIT